MFRLRDCKQRICGELIVQEHFFDFAFLSSLAVYKEEYIKSFCQIPS